MGVVTRSGYREGREGDEGRDLVRWTHNVGVGLSRRTDPAEEAK